MDMRGGKRGGGGVDAVERTREVCGRWSGEYILHDFVAYETYA